MCPSKNTHILLFWLSDLSRITSNFISFCFFCLQCTVIYFVLLWLYYYSVHCNSNLKEQIKYVVNSKFGLYCFFVCFEVIVYWKNENAPSGYPRCRWVYLIWPIYKITSIIHNDASSSDVYPMLSYHFKIHQHLCLDLFSHVTRGLYHDGRWTDSELQDSFRVDQTTPIRLCWYHLPWYWSSTFFVNSGFDPEFVHMNVWHHWRTANHKPWLKDLLKVKRMKNVMKLNALKMEKVLVHEKGQIKEMILLYQCSHRWNLS